MVDRKKTRIQNWGTQLVLGVCLLAVSAADLFAQTVSPFEFGLESNVGPAIADAPSGGLLNFPVQTSDRVFDDFISPITNPVFFEDPRNVTEWRPIFIRHQVPAAAGGGNVHVIAAQIRASLTENISLIATKDGFITSENPLVDDGWADVAAGLKFNLFKDYQNGRLLSGGLTYEIPAGSERALQGNGDGEFNIFLTGGTRVGALGHWISATGFRLPANRTDESQIWYWSNHFDRQIARGVYGLIEFNWYHWMNGGLDGPIPGIEGGDLFNLGAPGVSGNNIVTGAFGVKLKPNRGTEIGVAWELPLTERRDILDNRLTVDWIIRF